MSIKYYYRVLVLSLLSFNVCFAGQNEDFSEQRYYEDLTEITSATRLPQSPEESPVSITIIDRKMIEASSAIEIVDLLRLVPGMRVAHANGNLFSVVYHGYATSHPNRMQVLIDGRSVFTPLYSIVDWNTLGLTINDIEHIEVVRGPNSAAYGANAVRGTINMVTRKPFQVEGQTIALTAGDIGTKNASYRYAGVQEDSEYRLSLSTKQDDGFVGVDDHKKISALTYRGIYTPSSKEVFDIQLGLSGGPRGSWGVPGNIETPVRTNDSNTHYESLQWSRSLDNHKQQQWNLTNNFISWDDGYVIDLSTLGMPGETATYSLYSGNATRTELEFQQTHSGYSGMRFVWGGSHKVDRLKNSVILNRPDYISVDSQRFFSHIENQLNRKTILNVGIMAENNGLVGFYVSPRLSLNYVLTPNHSARISAARSKRTPSLYESYNDNIARLDSNGSIVDIRYKSDPNLSEETLTDYELAYIGHYMHNKLDIDAKIYYERFDDLISNVSDRTTYPDLLGSDTFIWMNSGYTINKGAEFQLKFTGEDGWSADAQYAYSRLTGTLLRNINPTSLYQQFKVERFMPKHSYSLLLSKKLSNKWQASAGYYFTSAMEWLGGGYLEDTERTDIKVTKSFDLLSSSGMISLVIQNIMDDYFEYENQLNSNHIPNVFETRGYLQLEVNY